MRNIEQARVELCRAPIGAASWCPFHGIFGDLHHVLHHMLATPHAFSSFLPEQDEVIVAVESDWR